MTDKLWDALTTVMRMNDKVEQRADTIKTQQAKIEGLTERVIRFETALEMVLTGRTAAVPAARRIEPME